MRASLAAHWHANERLRFLAIGGWNTLFGYACFVGLYWWLHEHLHYLVIGVLAHCIAAINAFACHRWLVFRSRGAIVAEFVRFNVTLLFVLACGLVALWLLVTVLHLSPLRGQTLVTVGTILVSYIAHRRFSFAI